MNDDSGKYSPGEEPVILGLARVAGSGGRSFTPLFSSTLRMDSVTFGSSSSSSCPLPIKTFTFRMLTSLSGISSNRSPSSSSVLLGCIFRAGGADSLSDSTTGYRFAIGVPLGDDDSAADSAMARCDSGKSTTTSSSSFSRFSRNGCFNNSLAVGRM
jgi:hypothetical protein